ncbi:MAG: 6,7-dimethyl-8-ribityllumazine synthase, partial [Synechococcus sp. LacPavin_0920_WC12_MAG_50_7]|nr:6,7-dimethyl-8-ribityllumazine synthase [Synechococcus sp. LacPavin_0920_WC12_MAG_50_7]
MTVFEGRFTDTADLRIAVVIARFNDLVSGK